jgi:hypothetical protein
MPELSLAAKQFGNLTLQVCASQGCRIFRLCEPAVDLVREASLKHCFRHMNGYLWLVLVDTHK